MQRKGYSDDGAVNSGISHFCFSDPQISVVKTSQAETRDAVLCFEPAC